jgi:hypothetical protein
MFRMDIPQGKPQQAFGWSPPLVGDFHALDRFGDLVFGDEKGNVTPPPPTLSAVTGAKPSKADKADKSEKSRRATKRKTASADKTPGKPAP